MNFPSVQLSFFFFFNDTATTEIYTLSLHDALPICIDCGCSGGSKFWDVRGAVDADRKSTRLNSSHDQISYAVFCLKKKTDVERDAHAAQARATARWASGVVCARRLGVVGARVETVGAPRRAGGCARFFFLKDAATPEISPLSLPAALPI